jgi:hypothetical protein
MKKILTLSLTLISSTIFSQTADTTVNTKLWKRGGLTSLNFTQSSFTNWAAGGENAISATALTTFFANYKKGNLTWDTNLDMAYGLLKSGNVKVRKNEDKIDFSTKAGRYAFYQHWYYTAMLNFKTQFDNGYNLPDDSTVISHFMAPAYILAAIGLDYKTKDNNFSFFISPITSKTTIVNNQRLADLGAFGVEPATFDTVAGAYVMVRGGEMIRTEFGGYIRITYKKDIMKNVNLATKLELFSNYLEDPQNVDLNWEVLIAMKVNKLINVNVSTQMIYDHDIPVPVERSINGSKVIGTGPRLQFKEVLSIGISYKF